MNWSESPAKGEKGATVEEQEGYSGMFYLMLGLGIVGLVGFLMVAAGAAG